MAASLYRQVLDAVQSLVATTVLLPDMQDVEVRMVGRYFEGDFDRLPAIVIVHGDPELIELASFEGHRYTRLDVVIACLAASNADFNSRLDTYLLWRENLHAALDRNIEPLLPGMDNIANVAVLPKEIIDSQLANRGYAYTATGVTYTLIEERPN